MSRSMQNRGSARIRSLASATSMATRLPAAVIVVSLASLITAIIVAVDTGRDLGQDLTDDRLRSLQASAVLDVTAHFNGLSRTSQALASSPQAVEAVDAFAEAHRELLDLDAQGLRTEAEAVVSSHTTNYFEPLRELGREVELRDVSTENPASIYIQFHYAVDLGVVDRPRTIDNAQDGSAWSEVHDTMHPVYRGVVEQRGLVDLYLVEPTNANVVYSVRKRPDIGTSLEVGPFSGTLLATVVDQVIDDPSTSVVIGDLGFYLPAFTTPVGVVASPIMDGDRLAGVLVLMYDSEPVTTILTADGEWDDGGFPPTGQSYVVSADGTTRSEPRSFLEDPLSHLASSVEAGVLSEDQRAVIEKVGTTVLSQPAVGRTVRAGLRGISEVETRSTMIGTEAFSTIAPVPIDQLGWFVVTEIDVDAAEGELDDFEELLVVGTAIFVVGLAFAAVSWANRIVRPIRVMSERLTPGTDSTAPIEVPPRSPIEFHQLSRSFESMSTILEEQRDQLADARAERLRLLRRMLPPAVADRVAAGDLQSLEEVPQATVAVIVVLGLGDLIRTDSDGSERDLVDRALGELDQVAEQYGLERVKVLGDAYFAACGHDRPYIDHAPRAVSFAVDSQNAIAALGSTVPSGLDTAVGLHTGPVTVGMTGTSRLLYDVWGATVTNAHHLARLAGPGEILASDETRALLPETIDVEPGGVDDTTWRVSNPSTEGNR